jgi:PKD repeat protein
MLLVVQNEKVEMRNKKISWGIALVFVMLITGLLAGSASAATIEEAIWVSQENTFSLEFTVEESGMIYAEAKLEEQVGEPSLILDFISAGERKRTIGGKSGELLTLSYDVSELDLEVGTRWQISVGSGAGAGSGYIKIDYPSDTTPPTVIETTPTGENVPVATEITITFSEQMDVESVIGAFSIYPEVSGEFYWEENTVIFAPSSNLNYGTGYVVELVGALDLAGNNLNYYNWEFETVSPPELIPPTAIMSTSSTEINEGETVSFSAEASSDQDGDIVSYVWDFGDGSAGEGVNVEHVYSQSGHYTVTLTVTDNDGLSGNNRVEIAVNPRITSNIPPTAYIDIYPNPATEGEGEEITFEGYGDDEDGEVVECRWTFPDGRTFSDSGSSSWFTLEPEEAQEGEYSFAVRDDDGVWSEGAGSYLELASESETIPPGIPWRWLLAATVLVIAAVPIIRKVIEKDSGDMKIENGSIYADSNPPNALIFLDMVYGGLSPETMHEVPVGTHNVKFRKFGYFDCEREAIVNANQTTPVHCDLTKLPEIKLKLSAEPAEITADGTSKSTITIRIEDNNGIPLPVPEDVTVELSTDAGTIESPVRIPAGHASALATLISSTITGTATVKAKAEFLKGSTAVAFLRAP